jgi:hypothetical protein
MKRESRRIQKSMQFLDQVLLFLKYTKKREPEENHEEERKEDNKKKENWEM